MWMSISCIKILFTMMKLLCLFLAACHSTTACGPPSPTPAPPSYIEYIPGTLNVILSAPHGGSEKPSSIPDRTAGCYQSGECVWEHDCGTENYPECEAKILADSNTKDLTLKLSDALYDEFGEKPYVIINNLHRIKMDANRDKPEATFGDSEAETAWDDFQDYIEQASDSIGGRGLFFDIHGQAHDGNRTELGYMVITKRLNGDDGYHPVSKYSSIKTNAQRLEGMGVTFESLLRGSRSLGKYLADNGVQSIPSPDNPSPNGEPYFTGGFNIKTHGSRYGGEIDAIQIEASSSQRSDSVRRHYAKALAKAIKAYMDLNY